MSTSGKLPPSDASRETRRPERSGHLDRVIEGVLWNSRLIFAVAALSCLLLAFGLLWISVIDTLHMLGLGLHYGDSGLDAVARKLMRAELVGDAVKALDGFLLAMALMISAFGIYELFVSELDAARSHALGGRILVIRSLDDLKSRVGKVVLVIMVVTLFEDVLEFHAVTSLDLLALAGVIALSAGALYLNHRDSSDHADR